MDLAHPADADLGDRLIRTDARAWRERHPEGILSHEGHEELEGHEGVRAVLDARPPVRYDSFCVRHGDQGRSSLEFGPYPTWHTVGVDDGRMSAWPGGTT
jgi:hypothetical protein